MARFHDLPLELRQEIYSHTLTLDLRELQDTFFSGFQPGVFLRNSIPEEVADCIGDKRVISAERLESLQRVCPEFAARPTIGVRRDDTIYYNGHEDWDIHVMVQLVQELGVENVALDLRALLKGRKGVDAFLRRFLRRTKKQGLEVNDLVVFLAGSSDVLGVQQ